MPTRTCTADGCFRPTHARELCTLHYQRWRKHGTPSGGFTLRGLPVARFRLMTDEDGPLPQHDPDLGPCHLWRGATLDSGYGQFWISRTTRLAHRVSYELFVGPIPDGLTLDHLCRNRGCVNPAHLEPVTSRENTLRGETPAAINAVKVACVHGHAFDAANTYVTPDGRRNCRTCRRDANRRLAARRGVA